MRILVVDDDSAFRDMIVEVIKHRYPEVEIMQASNGIEAKDKFTENFFDVVVTDFEMPSMNGLGLLKFIKDSSTKSVPAVMISGNNSRQLQASVEGLGFKFLNKPFRLKELELILSDFESVH